MSLLSIQKLFKSYPNQGLVLENIQLDIPRGTSSFVFLGENGSGKTTLLKMISTLIEPDRGEISFNSESLNYQNKNLRSQVLYTSPEVSGFLPHLTGRENLEFWSKFFKKKKDIPKDWGQQNPFLEKKYSTFSSGMKQCLQVLFICLREPKLLLLDEPFKNLDEKKTLWAQEMILSHCKESLIGISAHELSEVNPLLFFENSPVFQIEKRQIRLC